MSRTKVERVLADAERSHEDDPERAELLSRARRFKTSWVELAEALTAIRKNGRWRQWGYDSLEEYAKTELHLRRETVDKLTASFAFLKQRAPDVLVRDGVTEPIPSYQSVDFLRRAESHEGAPEEAVAEIRRRVIEEAAPLTSVNREFRDVVFPLEPAKRKERDIAGLKNVAKRLQELLGETNVVPVRLASEVGSALEKLLSILEKDEEKAA